MLLTPSAVFEYPITMRLGLLFVLWAGLLLPAFAQNAPVYEVHPDYTVRQWTAQDGLPSTEFRDLLETREGYLWLATHEGLVRFDGHAFTVFNASNTPSLGNVVTKLAEGPGDTLWIASRRSRLTFYHGGRFTEVEAPDAQAGLLFNEAGADWKRHSNNALLSYQDGQLTPYRWDVLNTRVNLLMRDEQGRLWIGTNGDGLYRLDPGASSARRYTAADGLASLKIHNALLARDGMLWIALQRQVVRIQGDRIEPLEGPGGGVGSGDIWMQFQDEAGGVWFTSPREGWWRYEETGRGMLLPVSEPGRRARGIKPGPDGQLWRHEEAEPVGPQAGGSDLLYRGDEVVFRLQGRILFFAFDSKGHLWLGTSQRLFLLRRASLRMLSQVEGYQLGGVYAMIEDEQGRVAVASRAGTVVRVEEEEPSTLIPTDNLLLSLYEDRSGVLWVGGARLCTVAGLQCQPVVSPAQQARNVHAMLEDQRDRFWIAGKNGLLVGHRDKDPATWTSINAPSGLPHNWVVGILETYDGTLLFPTNGDGLLRYDENGDFEAFTSEDGLPEDIIHTIYEDHEGLLWLGVGGQGLCRIDRQSRLALAGADIACIDSKAGLYWDTIFAILEDGQGRFWFNTTNGIFWVEREALEAYFAGALAAVSSVSYTEIDGMASRVGVGRVNGSGLRLRTGQLWFSTREGVVIIDPKVVSEPMPPRVVIEKIRVGEQERSSRDAVALAASERDVEIHYTALEYEHPEDVRFQIQLEGYDTAWRNGGPERFATYTNLPPGRYAFQVRAALGGVWSEPTRLTIARAPFFWQTEWFLVVCILLVGAGVYGAFRYRLHRVEASNRELEGIVASRTEELRRANELKSRFLANISHEFRTPLTLTFGPLDDLLQGRFHVEAAARPHLERARRNGSRLLRLINQLLDLSKLDAGALVLHLRRQDMAEHLRQLAALFDSIAQTQGIDYSKHIPSEPLLHIYDRDKLEKVVVNLLSNAFKFTPQGRKVALSLKREDDDQVRLIVGDTGPGIAQEHLEHLFDRFYQIEGTTTRSHEGSGIGLALVKELVELHQGSIAVESTVGFGTRFTVLLPLLDHGEADEAVPIEADEGVRIETGEAASEAAPWEAAPDEAERLDHTISGSLRIPPNLASDTASPPDEEATVVLIVEDNTDMRQYIRAHLQDHFAILEAANGRRGLEQARETVPDLVLSDVMMPEMDGLDLCAALKADTATSHIPVVLLTAKAQVEHRIAGFESGADAYLPKPFNAEELIVRVRTLIAERERLRARFAGATGAQADDQPDPSGAQDAVTIPDGTESASPEPVPAEATLPPREAAFLEQIHSLIDEHLDQAAFGVDELADVVAMSPRQLLRKLRALTGETTAALIRRKRLEEAARLLGTGQVSVKEVAFTVGFELESSFSRAFAQRYGMPPSVYAEQAQQAQQG